MRYVGGSPACRGRWGLKPLLSEEPRDQGHAGSPSQPALNKTVRVSTPAARPLRPIYGWVEPGQRLDVVLAPMDIEGDDSATLTVSIPMMRHAHPQWNVNGHACFELEQQSITFDHPNFGTSVIEVHVTHSSGRGSVRPTNLGSKESMNVVIVHWLNIPGIYPGEVLADDGAEWSGRLTFESSGWQFTMDSRSDLSAVLRAASDGDHQFAMTHVGELRRTDGGAFDSETATHVLTGWQVALSFALGRWVAPSLPVGFSPEGRRVWEQWAPWRCDDLRGYESWWDTHTSDDLASFLSDFMHAFLSPEERPIVRHLALHIVAANHSGTTGEAKVMLAQAGLEYLGWVNLVLSKRFTQKEYKRLNAAGVLRTLLEDASIPTEVPTALDGLLVLGIRKGFDGPDATAWVRNRLVHPKDSDEPYRIANLVWQTSQLLLEYAELLLLHRLGYNGRFMRRYPPHRFANSNEVVPWAVR